MLADSMRDRAELSASVFDVCIIGAGVAGITLASKLGQAGRRVLLVEAGERDPSQQSQNFYRGAAGDLENLPLHETRIRAFGGSSHHWGGWCRTFDALDFERSNLLPWGAWPITKRDLDPYFQEAAARLGITQFRGADADLADAGGNLQTIRMYFSEPPANLGSNFYDEMQRSNKVSLLLNAPYLSAAFAHDRPGIISIAVHDPRSHADLICKARQFIFAMGTVENVRHLLIMKRKYGSRLDKAEVLGRYYLQHLHQELGQFVILEGVTAKPAAEQIVAFMASTKDYLRKKGHGAFRLYSTSLSCSGLIDRFNGVVNGASCRAASAAGAIYITGEQMPNADSRILLIDEEDELGLPRVKLDWRISDDDRVAMREAALEFGSYLIRAEIGRLRVNPAILTSAQPLQGWTALGGAPGAAGHQMGGARMSSRADDGVVDGDCRVWGVENLYVAGSAVFRNSGHAPPTLTIAQLALRLADTLHRKLAG